MTITNKNRESEILQSGRLTVSVRSLRPCNDGTAVSVGILIESGEHYEQKNLLLSMEQYCEIKPQKGVISEEIYERMEEASNLFMAMRCGENLLSYSANSMRALTRKLIRRGYSREVAERAAEKLCEMGLINESEDLKREIERCLQKLWGEKRIRAHLWTKGFGTDAMAQVSDLLSEVDFVSGCAQLINKHYGGVPTEPEEQKRMIASLARYGYALGEIRQAIRNLNEG